MILGRMACLAVALPVLLGGCVLGSMDEPWESPTTKPEPASRSGPRVAAPEEADRVRSEQREVLVAAGSVPLADRELGFYLDVQEGRLRRDLGAGGATVLRQGRRILVRLPDRLTFAQGSDRLSEAAQPMLRSVAEILIEFERSLVTLYGHSDGSGPADYNRRLSQRRAAAVARFLQSAGVAADRLLVVGLGESRPLAENDSEAGRALNRRVEIVLEPLAASG